MCIIFERSRVDPSKWPRMGRSQARPLCMVAALPKRPAWGILCAPLPRFAAGQVGAGQISVTPAIRPPHRNTHACAKLSFPCGAARGRWPGYRSNRETAPTNAACASVCAARNLSRARAYVRQCMPRGLSGGKSHMPQLLPPRRSNLSDMAMQRACSRSNPRARLWSYVSRRQWRHVSMCKSCPYWSTVCG